MYITKKCNVEKFFISILLEKIEAPFNMFPNASFFIPHTHTHTHIRTYIISRISTTSFVLYHYNPIVIDKQQTTTS